MTGAPAAPVTAVAPPPAMPAVAAPAVHAAPVAPVVAPPTTVVHAAPAAPTVGVPAVTMGPPEAPPAQTDAQPNVDEMVVDSPVPNPGGIISSTQEGKSYIPINRIYSTVLLLPLRAIIALYNNVNRVRGAQWKYMYQAIIARRAITPDALYSYST